MSIKKTSGFKIIILSFAFNVYSLNVFWETFKVLNFNEFIYNDKINGNQSGCHPR